MVGHESSLKCTSKIAQKYFFGLVNSGVDVCVPYTHYV